MEEEEAAAVAVPLRLTRMEHQERRRRLSRRRRRRSIYVAEKMLYVPPKYISSMSLRHVAIFYWLMSSPQLSSYLLGPIRRCHVAERHERGTFWRYI
ncbi:putative auxin-responsive protein SAUR32 [Iris pallida]|uniref:Auxin-responsive protein SAUR32 n=1 Tax=Iris pallida TaxID=29817 RepID=A0AAX6E3G0_IRIPA|nr:putative auxin-responsive protein SAUR32 [Iris pallida]